MNAFDVWSSSGDAPGATITLLMMCRVRDAGFSDQPTSDVILRSRPFIMFRSSSKWAYSPKPEYS